MLQRGRETVREGVQQSEACPLQSTSGKVILQEAIIASIIAIKLQRAAVSKDK